VYLQLNPASASNLFFNSPPRSLAIKEFFSRPKSNHILKPEDCLSEPCTILQLDMRTVQVPDLEVRDGCASGIKLLHETLGIHSRHAARVMGEGRQWGEGVLVMTVSHQ
jgi:hypothetical protein